MIDSLKQNIKDVIKAHLGVLIYDELGKEVVTKFNERFGRIEGDILPTPKDQPIYDSNLPRSLGINQILLEISGGKIRVLNPLEVIKYIEEIPESKTTYGDTNSVFVYPNKEDSGRLRREVSEIIGCRSDFPLVVSNIGVRWTDNKRGFIFVETPYMEIKPESAFEREQKVIYNYEKGILEHSEGGVRIVPPIHNLGFNRCTRQGSLELRMDTPSFFDSDEYGRINLIIDSEGLEKYLKALQGTFEVVNTGVMSAGAESRQNTRVLKEGALLALRGK